MDRNNPLIALAEAPLTFLWPIALIVCLALLYVRFVQYLKEQIHGSN